MSIITILLFFIYTYGIGYSLSFYIKSNQEFFEKHIMRIGIGLGVFPFLLVLLNLLRIPLDWRIILLLSLILPIYNIIINFKNIKINFKLTKSGVFALLAIAIFIFSLFMYSSGAFKYPYLEDDDPWAHSTGIKYVAVEKKIDDPHNQFFYILPYPPGYDALFGVLHQTTKSLMWTMKFFNALIIALGGLFFYFFAKNFFGNQKKALAAMFILAMVPAYLSHFIWAHSLVVTIFIVAMYCLLKIKDNRNWIYPTMFVIAGSAVTQPTQPIKFLVIYVIYLFSFFIINRKINFYQIGAIFAGYFVSLIWWFSNWKVMFFKVSSSVQEARHVGSGISRIFDLLRKAFPNNSGTATRPYDFQDFFLLDKPGMQLFQGQNMINNPVGIGIVALILMIIGILIIFITFKHLSKERKTHNIFVLLMLLFTFLGVNTLTFNLPIGLFTFRFWMLFAIPVALIAAEGFHFIVGFLRHFKIPKIAVVIVLILLVFFTSGKQKYEVNTAYWGPGAMWVSPDEAIGYSWLKDLEPNTLVFAYSNDEQAIGYDAYSCMWCDNVVEFRNNIVNVNSSELYIWLKNNNYEYLLLDAKSFRYYPYLIGDNLTQTLLPKRFEEITRYEGFQLAHQTNTVMIFKIL